MHGKLPPRWDTAAECERAARDRREGPWAGGQERGGALAGDSGTRYDGEGTGEARRSTPRQVGAAGHGAAGGRPTQGGLEVIWQAMQSVRSSRLCSCASTRETRLIATRHINAARRWPPRRLRTGPVAKREPVLAGPGASADAGGSARDGRNEIHDRARGACPSSPPLQRVQVRRSRRSMSWAPSSASAPVALIATPHPRCPSTRVSPAIRPRSPNPAMISGAGWWCRSRPPGNVTTAVPPATAIAVQPTHSPPSGSSATPGEAMASSGKAAQCTTHTSDAAAPRWLAAMESGRRERDMNDDNTSLSLVQGTPRSR